MPKTSKAVTRVELCEAVYQKVGLSRTESSAFVELVLKEITDCLEKGETVKLSSFGSFMVREKGGRLGRNPKTGIEVPISPRRVVVFKPSAIMKQQVNSQPPGSGAVAGAETRSSLAGGWMRIPPEQRAQDVAVALRLAAEPAGLFEVAGHYGPSRIAEPVAHVAKPGKIGAVLLDFTEQGEGQ